MRLTLLLSFVGALGLILGAGSLAQPGASTDRALPTGPIQSAAIDAAPVQIDIDVNVNVGGSQSDPLAGYDPLNDESVSIYEPDPFADPLQLATLPGRGQHSQSAYMAGSSGSDLPLEEGVELYQFEDLILPDYLPPAVLDEDEERGPTEAFPQEVLDLAGERIALEGFMQPLEFNGNKVVSFVLSPYPPGCCFGGMPGLDEWVDVVVEGEGVDYFAYRVIRVTGELEVGEELDDWGYVASLYRMSTDKVEKLW